MIQKSYQLFQTIVAVVFPCSAVERSWLCVVRKPENSLIFFDCYQRLGISVQVEGWGDQLLVCK